MSPAFLIRRLVSLGALAATPLAQAGHAHEHGIARVDVALDGAELTIALEMPLDSLLGFERAPRTPSERQAAQTALALLRDGAALWRPDAAAQCTLQAATVSATVLEPAGQQPGQPAGEHADVDAEYRFRCARPAQLAGLDVRLFEAFRRLERVDVQAALPSGQRQARLSRSQARLRLAK